MSEALLTLNVGSSSIKASLYGVVDGALASAPMMRAHLSGVGGDRAALHVRQDGREEEIALCGNRHTQEDALHACLDAIKDHLSRSQIIGVGHRIVHGGRRFTAPVRLTNEVIEELAALIPLAPGHQPHNLAGVRAVEESWPGAQQVACFDTSFHRSQPRIAQPFAIPKQYFDEGVLRYGFHGLSYDYIAGVANDVIGAHAHEKMIVAHLGAGASLCAIRNGRSVASTMGFTALDGLPMATRCGDIDPGVLLHWMREEGQTAQEIEKRLYKESGLLGLSDLSGDMRVLEESEEPEAREAIDYLIHHCVRQICALAGVLGGINALVFTAGIGEHSALIRARILQELEWLGFALDEAANSENATRITTSASERTAWIIPTNEELMIAWHTLRLMRSDH